MNTFYFVVPFFLIFCSFLAFQVQKEVPLAYMDEIFHIPQAQAYCQFQFSKWDEKITTFPGLYLMTLPLHILKKYLIGSEECSISFLRSVNLLFAVITIFIFKRLISFLHPKEDDSFRLFRAITLTLFPVLFFFNFLYYTDSGSILFTFWMYELALQKRYWLSSLMAGISILFRQTNVIWVAFVVISDILEQCEAQNQAQKKDQPLVSQILQLITFGFSHLFSLIEQFWSFLILVISFIIFVVINKGIVVGDRTAHEAVLNVGQYCYFLGFNLFFLAMDLPFFFDSLKDLYSKILKLSKTQYLTIVVASCITLIGIHYYSPAHLYLLSDNRHFTFYIWKKIYERFAFSKYVLLPLYGLGFYLSWRSLRVRHSSLWCLGFFLCCGAVLIPALLMEFRYYLIPFLWISLHVPSSKVGTLLQLLAFVSINGIVFYLFLMRPFTWPSGEIARFMW